MVPDSPCPLALGMACSTWGILNTDRALIAAWVWPYGRSSLPISSPSLPGSQCSILPCRALGLTHGSTLPCCPSRLTDNQHAGLHSHHSHCSGLKARLASSILYASGSSSEQWV